MKKKILLLIFGVILIFCLNSCKQSHQHEFGEWMTAKASTCKEEGVEERYCYCLEKETRPAPLGAHTPGEAANCLIPQYCTVCKEKLTNTSSHTFGDWMTAQAATCTSDGWKERLCSVCGKTEKQSIPHAGHQYGEWTVVREATCTAPGLREKACVCGTKTSETITVDHTGEWTVLKTPTKTEDGARERTCESCREKMTEILYAFGSVGLTYEKDTLKNTCTVTGIGTCTETDVVIPSVFDGCTVTAIADGAFENCLSMTSLTIPETVEKIGKGIVSGAENLHTLYYNTDDPCSSDSFQNAPIQKVVFGGNSISWISVSVEEVVLSEKITVIPRSAFDGCSALKNLVISDSVTKIEQRAFADCSGLVYIEIPSSVTLIGKEAFTGCISLKGVMLKEGLKKIGNSAFSGCTALTALVIPDSVTEIGSHAFFECTSLKSATLSKGMTKIEISLFSNCSALAEVILPEGVTVIENSAFSGCKLLTRIALPESLTGIQGMAFYKCASLTDVVIPEKVTALNAHTFAFCDSLTSVTLHSKLTYASPSLFTDCAGLRNVNFLGTMQEWETVSGKLKPEQWGADIRTVTCTDGIIQMQ